MVHLAVGRCASVFDVIQKIIMKFQGGGEVGMFEGEAPPPPCRYETFFIIIICNYYYFQDNMAIDCNNYTTCTVLVGARSTNEMVLL